MTSAFEEVKEKFCQLGLPDDGWWRIRFISTSMNMLNRESTSSSAASAARVVRRLTRRPDTLVDSAVSPAFRVDHTLRRRPRRQRPAAASTRSPAAAKVRFGKSGTFEIHRNDPDQTACRSQTEVYYPS